MLNNIKQALLITGAMIVALVGIDKMTTETLLLNGVVESKSMTELTKELTNDGSILNPLMRTRLIINSPGGIVNQLDLFRVTTLAQGRTLHTEVPVFAASAATDLFLMGDTRLMGRDATLIFHEIRLLLPNGMTVTYSDLKSVFENNTLAPNSSLVDFKPVAGGLGALFGLLKPEAKDVKFDVVAYIKDFFGDKLAEEVRGLQRSHEKHLEFIAKRLGVSIKFVEENLIIPNIDNKIDFKEAIKLGVATGELR